MSSAMPNEFLKCDAPDCDHFEQTPITIEVVDKACPKCGANLCTAEDYATFKVLQASSRALNELAVRSCPDVPFRLVATNIHNGVIRVTDGPISGKNPFPNKQVQS